MQDERTKTARKSIGTNELPVCYREWGGIPLSHRPSLRILDFGCGYGQGLRHLQNWGYHAHGYDLDPSKATQAGLHPVMGPEDPPKERSYDYVILSNVLNVQSSEQQLIDTLHTALSFLKPNGFLVYNYPAKPRKLGWIGPLLHDYLVSYLKRYDFNYQTALRLWKVESPL